MMKHDVTVVTTEQSQCIHCFCS